MGQFRGKRGQNSEDFTCKTKPAVASSVPSTRGIVNITKAKSPSSMQIPVASVPSSEVANSQDGYGASLKSN